MNLKSKWPFLKIINKSWVIKKKLSEAQYWQYPKKNIQNLLELWSNIDLNYILCPLLEKDGNRNCNQHKKNAVIEMDSNMNENSRICY